MIIENLSKLLEHNEIKVKIDSKWFKLESISCVDGVMPIVVTDDDEAEYTGYDMADIDEFDPIFKEFKGLDHHIIGEA